MKKRLLKVAVTTALTIAFAVPAFANPFNDVPAKHWAYDAVNKLVKAGVVDGYNDGTFRGDKTVTRYEMAQIVAKAMTKSVSAEQKAVIDQLSQEFATELNTMGVKVEGMQKQLDNMVKVSGDARVRHDESATDYRARLTFNGKINDNMSFSSRITSGNVNFNGTTAPAITLDTANATFNVLGAKTTVGRQDMKLGTGFIFDSQMTGVASQIGGLKLFAGNQKDATRVYAGEYSTDIYGAKFTADYYKNDASNKEIYGVNTSFKLLDNVTGVAEYYKNNNGGAVAKAYGAKINSLGLSAIYRDVEAGALNSAYTTLNDITAVPTTGFKGMEYQLDRNLDKNTTLTVKHRVFNDTTLASINVKF